MSDMIKLLCIHSIFFFFVIELTTCSFFSPSLFHDNCKENEDDGDGFKGFPSVLETKTKVLRYEYLTINLAPQIFFLQFPYLLDK